MQIEYAVVSEVREREYMEDRHSIDTDFAGRRWIFGGVYDGHGGDIAAEAAAVFLPEFFRQEIGAVPPEEAFVRSYKRVHREVSYLPDGGACAANFLIKNGQIVHANVGDVRIVVFGQGMRQLTTDHRTSNLDERQRILASHGTIDENGYVCYRDTSLMPTRAIGDHNFRRAGVLHVPTVGVYHRQAEDRFLVAASDGLWDKVENFGVWLAAEGADTAHSLADRLHALCIEREVSDNLTIVVVKLSPLT